MKKLNIKFMLLDVNDVIDLLGKLDGLKSEIEFIYEIVDSQGNIIEADDNTRKDERRGSERKEFSAEKDSHEAHPRPDTDSPSSRSRYGDKSDVGGETSNPNEGAVPSSDAFQKRRKSALGEKQNE